MKIKINWDGKQIELAHEKFNFGLECDSGHRIKIAFLWENGFGPIPSIDDIVIFEIEAEEETEMILFRLYGTEQTSAAIETYWIQFDLGQDTLGDPEE